jgi:hypothetical protein
VSRIATFAPLPPPAPRAASTSHAPGASIPPRASNGSLGDNTLQVEPHGRKFHCVRCQSPGAPKIPVSFGIAAARAR